MAAQKGNKNTVPANKDLMSRINFLHQASLLLAKPMPALSRTYVQDLKGVARKSQLSIDKDIKRQLCKRCDTILVDGVTSSRAVINNSRAKRADCDVLRISCNVCQASKNFPLSQNEVVKT